MKGILVILLVLALASFSYAGECPAGASDCFLCGGGGIPCARSDACAGGTVEGVSGGVACACPQGKPCVCYCPYSQYGQKKDQLNPSNDRCAGCLYGCSGSGVCYNKKIGDIASADSMGGIDWVEGELLVSNDGGASWAKAAAGTRLGEGHMLMIDGDSKAKITLDDGSRLYLEEGAVLTMKELKKTEKGTLDVVIELMKAAIFSDVTKRDGTRFEVDTGVSVIGVKGTQFSVSYDPEREQSVTKVYAGNVSVRSASGTTELGPGQMVTTGQAGNGAVREFDQASEQTPFGGGGCGGAAILLPLLLLCFRATHEG